MKYMVLFYLVLMLSSFNAQASLQVYPTRVFIDEKSRGQTLSLKHTGARAETYKISVVYYKMKPDGSVEKRQPTEPLPSDFAKGLFRYSPKRVTLEPGNTQILRIKAKSLGRFKAGEYRAHFLFQPIGEGIGESQATMQLRAKVAVAIPIVVSKGKQRYSAEIAELQLQRDSARFSAIIRNTGTGYLFGEISLYHQTNQRKKRLFYVKGVSSYIPERKVDYKISEAQSLKDLNGGQLLLEYRQPEKLGGALLGSQTVGLK